MTRDQLLRALSLLGWLVLGVACEPSKRCDGERYFDPENLSCRPCPSNATFESGTCVCGSGLEFANHRCRPRDDADEADASQADETADGGATGQADCEAYCEFLQGCFGDNDLAARVGPEVITALDADNPSACMRNCGVSTSRDEGSVAVTTCVDDGLVQAACVGDDSVAGLVDALELIGGCCAPAADSDLCGSFCDGVNANPIVGDMVDFCR